MSVAEQDGSTPLTRPRDERMAHLLFQSERDGQRMTQVEAWLRAGGPTEIKKPSSRVSASKAFKRGVQARVAWLRQQDAQRRVSAKPEPIEAVTADNIAALMDSVSKALTDAAKAAKSHGANNVSRQLMKSLTTHAGRVGRVSGRVDRPQQVADEGEVAAMASSVVRNLPYCSCKK